MERNGVVLESKASLRFEQDVHWGQESRRLLEVNDRRPALVGNHKSSKQINSETILATGDL